MNEKLNIFWEVYQQINDVISDVFECISNHHKHLLIFNKAYYFGWYMSDSKTIGIEYYDVDDPSDMDSCYIPIEVVLNGTWKDYIESGEWLKNHN